MAPSAPFSYGLTVLLPVYRWSQRATSLVNGTILHRDPGTTTLQQACEVSPAMRPAMMPQSVVVVAAGGSGNCRVFLGVQIWKELAYLRYTLRYSRIRIITFLVGNP